MSGCGDSEKSAEPTTTASVERVPSALGKAESGAEDIIDFARSGNRSNVVATARGLREVAEGRAASALRSAGVPAKRIAALKSRARRVDDLSVHAKFLDISLAANQISGLMPEFYARFSDPVPPEVLKLDYLDREAQLRSQAGQSKAVQRAVLALIATWDELRSRVVDAGGADAADDFSRHVESMGRLAHRSTRRPLQKEASRGLELVDVLEGVFR